MALAVTKQPFKEREGGGDVALEVDLTMLCREGPFVVHVIYWQGLGAKKASAMYWVWLASQFAVSAAAPYRQSARKPEE